MNQMTEVRGRRTESSLTFVIHNLSSVVRLLSSEHET
jgi:hypothetical protein